MKNILFYIIIITICLTYDVTAQSKNEQIDQLKMDLDSSKNQQLKLVDQIIELNKIIFSNQENNKMEVEKFDFSIKQLDSKIIILQNELDSLKEREKSKSKDLPLNGKYEYDEKFDGFEDGKGGFVGGGSINISNFKKSESFYFEIEVARVFGEDYAFNGEITGEAEIIGDNIARFYNEGCNLLVFIFKDNYVQIIEERCEEYHGGRVSFDGIYTKN